MRLSIWVGEREFYQLKKHLDSEENSIVPVGKDQLWLKGVSPVTFVPYKDRPMRGHKRLRVIINHSKIRFLL